MSDIYLNQQKQITKPMKTYAKCLRLAPGTISSSLPEAISLPVFMKYWAYVLTYGLLIIPDDDSASVK